MAAQRVLTSRKLGGDGGGPRLWGARKLTPASPSLVRCGAGALIATLTMLIVWAGAMAN